VARVGAEKNHVCIYISAGIKHSTEKSRHKTQTGSRRGIAHPLNTQWPCVADVRARLYPERCFYYSADTNYERDGILIWPPLPAPPLHPLSPFIRLIDDERNSRIPLIPLEESCRRLFRRVALFALLDRCAIQVDEESGDRGWRHKDAAGTRRIKKQGSTQGLSRTVSINDTNEGLGVSTIQSFASPSARRITRTQPSYRDRYPRYVYNVGE